MKIKVMMLFMVGMSMLVFSSCVKLDESIKNDTSALLRQGQVNKPEESVINNEPIRPDEPEEKKPSEMVASIPENSKEVVVDKVVVMDVTAYCFVPKGKGINNSKKRRMNGTGITKSGKVAKVGFAAADLDRFPLGTVFYAPKFGRVVVKDTGGNIIGNKIDIFVKNYKTAKKFGKQKLFVIVSHG